MCVSLRPPGLRAPIRRARWRRRRWREISTRPSGSISRMKASIFWVEPEISKMKDWLVLSIARARKMSAILSDSTRFSPLPATFTRASSRSTNGPSMGQVDDLADRHQPAELCLDLLDDHRCAGGHTVIRDSASRGSTSAPSGFRYYSRGPENRPMTRASTPASLSTRTEIVCRSISDTSGFRTVRHQTSTMPSSETGASASSPAPAASRLWAAPEGIIGKQFSV